MILLGCTGSIGVNTLCVARDFQITPELLSAGRNIKLLNQQIKEFSPKAVAISHPEDLALLKPCGARVYVGQEGLQEAILQSESDLVLNGMSGGSGLRASLAAQKAGKTLALANKESLVMAGWLFDRTKIIPVDSEHFSLWYLLRDVARGSIKQIFITASGGAFRDSALSDIPKKRAKEALKHPNWKMGAKITIDSASMVNKLFEMLEAHWLFGQWNASIDALIERGSKVHALVGFKDGTFSAHLSQPDMRLPIAYALNPKRAREQSLIAPLKPGDLGRVEFEEIDPMRYPVWALKEELLETPKLGIVLHAANEILVEAFLQERILFGAIASGIFKAIHRFGRMSAQAEDLEGVLALDSEVKEYVRLAFDLGK